MSSVFKPASSPAPASSAPAVKATEVPTETIKMTPPAISPTTTSTPATSFKIEDQTDHIIDTPMGQTTIKKTTDNKSMTFSVGDGLPPEQKKAAEQVIQNVSAQGAELDSKQMTVKLPFVDKGFSTTNPFANSDSPLSKIASLPFEIAMGAPKIIEWPERIVNDISDSLKAITGHNLRDPNTQFDAGSYLRDTQKFKDSWIQNGGSPLQAEIVGDIYGVSQGILDLVPGIEAIDRGISSVARFAPVEDDAVRASSDILGNPKNMDEANAANRNIQKFAHPDKGASANPELSAKANNAVAVLKNYFDEQSTFLGQLGMTAKEIEDTLHGQIFTPAIIDPEMSSYMEGYGTVRPLELDSPEMLRSGLSTPTDEAVGAATERSVPSEQEMSIDQVKEALAPVEKALHTGIANNLVKGNSSDDRILARLSNRYPEMDKEEIQGIVTEAKSIAAEKGNSKAVSEFLNRQFVKGSSVTKEEAASATKPKAEEQLFTDKDMEAMKQPTLFPSVENLSPINTQSGFVNPGAVTKEFNTVFDKIKQNIADANESERIRAIFTGFRDAQITETNQLGRVLKGMLPSATDQEALLFYREFKNNLGELRDLLSGKAKIYDDFVEYFKKENPDATPAEVEKARKDAVARVKKFEKPIERAINATPAIKEADAKMTEYFGKRLSEGKALGLFKDDDEAGSMESSDYITHVLTKDPAAVKPRTNAGGGKMSRTMNFSKARTFSNILDAVAFGKTPATVNALDSMKIYGERFSTTAATNILIPALKDSGVAKWGTFGSENIPADWVPLNPQTRTFQNLIPTIDKEGKPQVLSQQLFVPQKIADALKPILDPDYLRNNVPGYGASRIYQGYLKAAELSLSLFHARALTLTAINNMGYVNAMKLFSEDMNTPTFLEAERFGASMGLTTSLTHSDPSAYKGLAKGATPMTRGELLKTLPVFKQVDQLSHNITYMTFDVMQRKFKVVDFTQKTAAWISKNPDATTEQSNQAFRDIAKEVNASYGGLHWENLGINKTALGIGRVLFLAPDWTYSNFLNAKYAFKGGPAGTAARAFWLRSVITGVVLSEMMSIFITGKPSKDPSSVYLGKDKAGKNIYSNVFFVGASGDLVNLIKNTEDYGLIQGAAQTTAGKLAPFPRFAIQMATNRDYAGRTIIPKGSGVAVGTARSLWEAVTNIAPVPFSISGPAGMFINKAGNYTLPEYIISGLTGARTRHVVPDNMREITSGHRKGQVVPAKPKEKNSAFDQIFKGKPVNKAKKK